MDLTKEQKRGLEVAAYCICAERLTEQAHELMAERRAVGHRTDQGRELLISAKRKYAMAQDLNDKIAKARG